MQSTNTSYWNTCAYFKTLLFFSQRHVYLDFYHLGVSNAGNVHFYLFKTQKKRTFICFYRFLCDFYFSQIALHSSYPWYCYILPWFSVYIF